MADDLVERCWNLQIEDGENGITDIGNVKDSEKDLERVSLMLVGKLVIDRDYNIEAFKKTMSQVWSVTRRIVIRMIGGNLFVFQFFHWKDKEKVLEGRPWSFENHLLVLNEVSGTEQPSEVTFTHSPFWLRLINLPFNSRSDVVVKSLVENMGNVIDIEEDNTGLERYRRVKINLDVTKPLRRYQTMKCKNGKVVKIIFKYERLPNFCYMCGVIGHGEKDCLNVAEEDRERGLGWGPRLRATPRRGRTRFAGEVEEVKSSFVCKRGTKAQSEDMEESSRSTGETTKKIDDEEEEENVSGRKGEMARPEGKVQLNGEEVKGNNMLVPVPDMKNSIVLQDWCKDTGTNRWKKQARKGQNFLKKIIKRGPKDNRFKKRKTNI